MSYKIGFLIPSTTTNRNWNNLKETYFYNIFLKSYIRTYDKEHNYTIYLIIDRDDKLYSQEIVKNELTQLVNMLINTNLTIIYSDDIPKGHVSLMWNKAFKQAYDDECDYFFQCGDDIEFMNPGWINASIHNLESHNNIGLTGPLDKRRWDTGPRSRPGGERFIQTQSFVSRKHMDIFGTYFPDQLKNWYCDDWMTLTYYPKFFYTIDHFCRNLGGTPRYEIIGSLSNDDPIKKKCYELVGESHKKIINYII
tara:strand:+ start:617 stop:1372 length:756 start_codon:yes stop_codon:yes gene_type:complete